MTFQEQIYEYDLLEERNLVLTLLNSHAGSQMPLLTPNCELGWKENPGQSGHAKFNFPILPPQGGQDESSSRAGFVLLLCLTACRGSWEAARVFILGFLFEHLLILP